jgi:adenosine deaminase
MNPFLADCHLHFEGCLPRQAVERLGGRAAHRFADGAVFDSQVREIRDADSFLSLFAEICWLFQSPQDYGEAAREIPRALASGGVRHAEVYVSPEIYSRIGLDPAACLDAVIGGLQEGAAQAGISCQVLLDAVRHWGPESAERVLDLYERHPVASIVGFGIGGDEKAVPAHAFAGAFLRARALGLKTCVHAGEWAGPEAIRDALDALRPDRVDHGITAASDPDLMARLAEEQVPLCVAPSGNVRTGAVASLEAHPLPCLLEAGVRVALCADDPLLFETTTLAEYRLARDVLKMDERALRTLAENSWHAAFCSATERREGLAGLKDVGIPD